MNNIIRCDWVNHHHYNVSYHDEEWGVSIDDDRKHFEILVLEGFQAGLSWGIILRKRADFRIAFQNFNIHLLSKITDKYLEKLMQNTSIIRNQRKIWSVRDNARAVLSIQKDFGSFHNFMWSHIKNKKIINYWENTKEIPHKTETSTKISKHLRGYGMNFVGPTIIYSYMQAAGMVNDHLTKCWRHISCIKSFDEKKGEN